MSPNIDSPEIHVLVERLTQHLDLPVTAAVTVVLEDKLAATDPDVAIEQRLARLPGMANAIAERLTLSREISRSNSRRCAEFPKWSPTPALCNPAR